MINNSFFFLCLLSSPTRSCTICWKEDFLNCQALATRDLKIPRRTYRESWQSWKEESRPSPSPPRGCPGCQRSPTTCSGGSRIRTISSSTLPPVRWRTMSSHICPEDSGTIPDAGTEMMWPYSCSTARESSTWIKSIWTSFKWTVSWKQLYFTYLSLFLAHFCQEIILLGNSN